MPKELKSLEDHEKDFWERFNFVIDSKGVACGIECPKCKAELMADYTKQLCSNPPQTPVWCPKCKWRGSIH